MNVTVSFKIRNGKDPNLIAKTLTQSTYNFGISAHDMFIMGVAFMVIGSLLAVQPVLVILKILYDARVFSPENLDQRYRSRKKEQRYAQQRDDNSMTEEGSGYEKVYKSSVIGRHESPNDDDEYRPSSK